MTTKIARTTATIAAAMMPTLASAAPPPVVSARPNIVVLLLDDVGFGHLSAFGGPVQTPNIDRVARAGLRFNNFHTTSLCSPSRAALLTGHNHHSAATGVITEMATQQPGYNNRFPKNKFPLVETLRQSGYHTAAFGKWHNTPIEQLQGPRLKHDQWPTDVGFERFYGFMAGDVSQWEPPVWDNTTLIAPQAESPKYHFTTDLADQAIKWMQGQQGLDSAQPLFLYFATGAGHAPHHAPPEYSTKYAGKFDQGWDKVRAETLARQKSMGLVPASTELSERPSVIQAWDKLPMKEKQLYARMQEIFAGYLEHADAQFGRVLAELERQGQLDNTIIIVTSDNGASGEGGLHGSFSENLLFNGIPDSLNANLSRIDQLGTKFTYNHYPAGWALAGNTPFRYWKQTTHEGGVRDPLIISWPGHISDAGGVRSQFTHIVDVMPTLLDLTGVTALSSVGGVAQAPLDGVSFAPALTDALSPAPKAVQYFEMLGNRSIWHDGWKADAFHGRFPWENGAANADFSKDKWELFKLDEDMSEIHDLASQYPEKVAELKALFDAQAKLYNVYPLDDRTLERMDAVTRAIVGGRSKFDYTQGDVGIAESASPPVKNRSHRIVAALNIPAEASVHTIDGVIVASGGRFGGYSLYIKDGRLHYTYNYLGLAQYDIESPENLPRGQVKVDFEFVRTGPQAGRGILSVNGRSVAKGFITQTVPRRFGLGDTFDIGSDYGSPVTDKYTVPSVFPGRIESVEVLLTDGPVAPELDYSQLDG